MLHGFSILANNQVEIKDAAYSVDVEPEELRQVELSLVTTTFKKEDYVTRNIARVKRGILGSNDPIASHFTLHVIDNGRTLPVEELEGPHICVHPNPNVGGSGGFARGMIESMNKVVEESSAKIKELEALSKKIEEFAAVISSISNRTNILSLNASIEAARAGEHGRGFAVVASEVRNLAAQSAKSVSYTHLTLPTTPYV